METFKEANTIELQVYEVLKTVLDPELGVNVVDLGLIYEIHFLEETGIKVLMTLTTPGCPMGDVIITDIEETLKKTFPEINTEVKLTWEPTWTTDFVKPEGREMLGMN